MQVKNTPVGVSRLPEIAAKSKVVHVGFGALADLRDDKASFELSCMPSRAEFKRMLNQAKVDGARALLKQRISAARRSTWDEIRKNFTFHPLAIVALAAAAHQMWRTPLASQADEHKRLMGTQRLNRMFATGDVRESFQLFRKPLQEDPLNPELYELVASAALDALRSMRSNNPYPGKPFQDAELPYGRILEEAATRAIELRKLPEKIRAPWVQANGTEDGRNLSLQPESILALHYEEQGQPEKAIPYMEALYNAHAAYDEMTREKLIGLYIRTGKFDPAVETVMNSIREGHRWVSEESPWVNLLKIAAAEAKATSPTKLSKEVLKAFIPRFVQAYYDQEKAKPALMTAQDAERFDVSYSGYMQAWNSGRMKEVIEALSDQ